MIDKEITTERLTATHFLTRRSFIVGLGSAIALTAAPLNAIVMPTAYVVFPGPRWMTDFETDAWRHRVVLRVLNLDVTPVEPMFNSVEMMLHRVDVEDGRADELVGVYNQAIENWRQRHGYSLAMMQAAAEGAGGRWTKKAGAWTHHSGGEESTQLFSIKSIKQAAGASEGP